MGLKTFTIDFAELSQNIDIKFSYSTLESQKLFQGLPLYRIKKIAKDIFAGGDKPEEFSEEKDEEYVYPVYSNGKENNGLFGYTNKFRVNSPCVTISARGTIGFAVARSEAFFPIVRLITIIVDEEIINNKYLEHIINYMKIEKSGNTIAQLTVPMVSNIKIPLIPKPKQDLIVAQIESIEKKIRQLRKKNNPQQEIINKVFSREFGIDENLYNEFGKGMTAGTQIAQNRTLRVFETDFKELARIGIVRCSTRFHNPPTKKLMDFLDNIETLQVKDILLEPVHRGASPKYNPEGEIPVIKTGHLKNGYIEISQEEFVDLNYYKSFKRSQVRQSDILIASTGKISLGKIDLLEEDQELVVDGHISIIRINDKKYNLQFFTYFFRTVLGFFQIERDFTGSTNQIELYADEISNFKIPNIPLTSQQKIVNEIKAKLDKQEEVKSKIEKERNKISKIIEEAIK